MSESIDFAKIDFDREERTGTPEIIFGEGKTTEQIETIIKKMRERKSLVIASRIHSDPAACLKISFPEGIYHPEARIFSISPQKTEKIGRGEIAVLAAGTSDLPVAEEACVTASLLGNQVQRYYDVGIAGLHRLLREIPRIREASVLIVVAGMEGALPSVVAGLVKCPVVAVPTSVGYGTGLGGISALLTMLNTCSPGVTVVNIDNGVGAAVAAHRMNCV